MLDARRREGLTASEVAERVADGRSNSQRQPTSRSVRDILRENIFTLFNGILTACFVVVVLLGDLRDGFFFGVVVVNALIGIVQELRAKRVLDKAALLAAPESRVRRDGVVVTVPLEQVVLDDLLVLRPGDQVPADAVVAESTGLSLDESLLTGESDPVFKDAGAPLLSGSHVATGTGYAVVTAVGADTQARRAADLVSSELPAIGLEHQLSQLNHGILGVVLHDPVVPGEAAVERPVTDVPGHLLGADQCAMNLGVVDRGVVAAAGERDLVPGLAEQVRGRLLE